MYHRFIISLSFINQVGKGERISSRMKSIAVNFLEWLF